MATGDKDRGTCFVVMGFGKKNDFENGRVLDLDKSYRNMIKPAVESAGLKCVRADEIVHSGIIDVPMYDQLLKADVVVADLSTSNKNAYYELGVRHALRPHTTVVISDDSVKNFPFDLSHVVIRQYHHLGEDIGFDEVMRFRELLTSAIIAIRDKEPIDSDSPVYTFLSGLVPPALADIQAKVQEVIKEERANADGPAMFKAMESTGEALETHSFLMRKADEAEKKEDWELMKSTLTFIRQMIDDERARKQLPLPENAIVQHDDPDLLQRLALATYKSKLPDEKTALLQARELLAPLHPDTSNDTETLGLWGAINKKLWDKTRDLNYLDTAIRSYERGLHIRNDYYNGINYAFLLNLRASQATDRAEAIADYVEARRVRRDVLQLCGEWLERNQVPDKDNVPEPVYNEWLDKLYWVKATQGEAYIGLGNEETAKAILDDAYTIAPKAWMKQSTEYQLTKLRKFLENSPLDYIRYE